MERRGRGASSSSLGLREGAAAGWHVSSLSPAGSARPPPTEQGQLPPSVPWVGDPLPASLKADPLETTRRQTHFLFREPITEIQGMESMASCSEDHGWWMRREWTRRQSTREQCEMSPGRPSPHTGHAPASPGISLLDYFGFTRFLLCVTQHSLRQMGFGAPVEIEGEEEKSDSLSLVGRDLTWRPSSDTREKVVQGGGQGTVRGEGKPCRWMESGVGGGGGVGVSVRAAGRAGWSKLPN